MEEKWSTRTSLEDQDSQVHICQFLVSYLYNVCQWLACSPMPQTGQHEQFILDFFFKMGLLFPDAY